MRSGSVTVDVSVISYALETNSKPVDLSVPRATGRLCLKQRSVYIYIAKRTTICIGRSSTKTHFLVPTRLGSSAAGEERRFLSCFNCLIVSWVIVGKRVTMSFYLVNGFKRAVFLFHWLTPGVSVCLLNGLGAGTTASCPVSYGT